MSGLQIAAYALAVGLLLFLCVLFRKPLRHVLVMTLQSALGGVGLYLGNFLLIPMGMGIGVNVVTASVCGVLGLPGFVLLILVNAVYTYL